MNFLKKTKYGQVYQKRTLIVTQADNWYRRDNNRIMNINKLENRHTIEDYLFRFDFSNQLRKLWEGAITAGI